MPACSIKETVAITKLISQNFNALNGTDYCKAFYVNCSYGIEADCDNPVRYLCTVSKTYYIE